MARAKLRAKRIAMIEQRMRQRIKSTLLKQTQWLEAREIATSETEQRRVERWRRGRKIFVVSIKRKGVTESRYPAYQFDEQGKPRPVVAQVLRIFSGKKDDPWKIAAWFGSVNGWLRGRAPKDCLAKSKHIIEAAKHEVEPICG